MHFNEKLNFWLYNQFNIYIGAPSIDKQLRLFGDEPVWIVGNVEYIYRILWGEICEILDRLDRPAPYIRRREFMLKFRENKEKPAIFEVAGLKFKIYSD